MICSNPTEFDSTSVSVRMQRRRGGELNSTTAVKRTLSIGIRYITLILDLDIPAVRDIQGKR